MRLLVDEDSQSKALVRMLRDAGHDVLTAREAGLNGMDDGEVLALAVRHERVLLTSNGRDFRTLGLSSPGHPGILAIYRDGDPSKDMTHADIVRAIENVATADEPGAGAFLVLNAGRWL